MRSPHQPNPKPSHLTYILGGTLTLTLTSRWNEHLSVFTYYVDIIPDCMTKYEWYMKFCTQKGVDVCLKPEHSCNLFGICSTGACLNWTGTVGNEASLLSCLAGVNSDYLNALRSNWIRNLEAVGRWPHICSCSSLYKANLLGHLVLVGFRAGGEGERWVMCEIV